MSHMAGRRPAAPSCMLLFKWRQTLQLHCEAAASGTVTVALVVPKRGPFCNHARWHEAGPHRQRGGPSLGMPRPPAGRLGANSRGSMQYTGSRAPLVDAASRRGAWSLHPGRNSRRHTCR
jgi:hypothetical protein